MHRGQSRVEPGLPKSLYTMGALAGDPRAKAHYMEMHEKDLARRPTSCVSAQEYNCAVSAWIVFVKKNMHHDLRSRHVCSLPVVVVQLPSQSPHLHAQGELHPFV
jgi:hypothetical protein